MTQKQLKKLLTSLEVLQANIKPRIKRKARKPQPKNTWANGGRV